MGVISFQYMDLMPLPAEKGLKRSIVDKSFIYVADDLMPLPAEKGLKHIGIN